ncbi:S-layer homology domain-containing protein, partial [Candidatus Gracilibacteria bacterium]|nr:S-layer homology domain-containing protein [Candidatus Gracilibacteria bacterium]
DQENIKNQDEVQRLTKVKILNEKGVNNTELFEGTRGITRSEFLAIVLQVHCYDVSHKPESLPFYDVDLDSWQARVIKVGSEIGLIQGYERDSRGIPFRPDVEISKIEAFGIMMKMKEIEKMESYKDRYVDKKADWQEKPLSTGEYLGILKPEQTDFRFNPDSHLTRDEMVKLIVDIVRLY